VPRTLTGPFNPFGRWIVAMCDLYAIPSAFALAQQAGISDNTLTESMREGKPGPTKNTVDRIWKALESLAADSPLRESLSISKEFLYNIAGFATSEQQSHAAMNLTVLEFFAKRESRIQQLEQHIQRLEREVEELRMRRRPRTP